MKINRMKTDWPISRQGKKNYTDTKEEYNERAAVSETQYEKEKFGHHRTESQPEIKIGSKLS